MLFTDEACVTCDGVFNSDNLHMMQNDNPHAVFMCGLLYIFNNCLVELYLLPSRLTGDMYPVFLREMLSNLVEDVPLPICRRMWFQQDGAPSYFSRIMRQHLDNTLANRWIGRNGPVTWPTK